MSLSIKNALQNHDHRQLNRLLAKDPSLIQSPILWGDDGENSSMPLHFLCDLIFEKMPDQKEAEQQAAITLAEILLHYGANLNGIDPKTGDSILIKAASQGAENFALWLLSVGANHDTKGLFGATALHWAAMMGQDRLLEALLHFEADIMLKDDANHGTPLDWAIYGWKHDDIEGKTNRQPICAAFLVGVGSPVTGSMLTQLDEQHDSLMLAVLEPDIINNIDNNEDS